jgi:hypothetical protein
MRPFILCLSGLLLTASLNAPRAHAQAGNEGPRQLGGPPAIIDSTRQTVAGSPSVGLGGQRLGSPVHLSQVGLKTGSVLSPTHIAAHYPLLGPSYLLLDGERRLALTEVSFYENETGSYRRARPRGHFRELTLRQVLPGRIRVYQPRTSLYQRLALSSALLAMGNPLAAASTAVIPPPSRGYFAKDDSPVYALRHAPLSRALSDNPNALTLEARAHRYEVANTASAVLGMGLFVGG